MTNAATWTPRVLSEYEIGRCVSAIEAVARMDKPIAEVGCQGVSRADLEADLLGCLGLVRHSEEIKFWVRSSVSGNRFRFGFYKQPWALAALDFLSHAELNGTDKAWIAGLLFGYQPSQIQAYIDRQPHQPDVTLASVSR